VADDALVFQDGKYEGEITSAVTVPSSENDNDGITGCEEMSYGDVIRKGGGGGVGDMYSDAKGEKGEASWAPWLFCRGQKRECRGVQS
jgi:hypothetical protein